MKQKLSLFLLLFVCIILLNACKEKGPDILAEKFHTKWCKLDQLYNLRIESEDSVEGSELNKKIRSLEKDLRELDTEMTRKYGKDTLAMQEILQYIMNSDCPEIP